MQMRKNWRWLVAAAAVFVPGIVTGALSLPYTFSAGQPIRAAEVNANFEALRARLDALGAPSAAAQPVGTLTLPNIVMQTPIRKFAQTVSVPWPHAAGAAPKPIFTDITIVRDLADGSPQLNQTANQGTLVPTADIVLGNLDITLTNVLITRVSVSSPLGDHPQETIGLSFQVEQWAWKPSTGSARQIQYNKTTGAAGADPGVGFKFGYFASGVAADSSYVPVAGYTQDVTCAPQQVCSTSAFVVQKSIGNETIDELTSLFALSAKDTLDLEWFLTAGTAANAVKLTNAGVVGLDFSTKDDGSLVESASFGYVQILWRTGTTQATWNLAKGSAT